MGADSLGSAPLPEPGEQDHIRGRAGARIVVEYADFECPFCAATHTRLAGLEIALVFRHFPVRSSHPRAWAAACAAEAAGVQDQFWAMHDRLFSDPARLEDPHLWQYARELDLDLERFDADRHSPAVIDRVSRDFRSGVRAGVVSTPALFTFADGRAEPTDVEALGGLRR